MKKSHLAGFLLLLIAALFGCRLGAEQDFEVNYKGEVSGEFSGKGDFIPCNQVNDGPLHTTISLQELSDRPGSSYVILTLPVGVQPGEYVISDTDFSVDNFGISVTIFDSKRDGYFLFPRETLISGSIRLRTIPNTTSQLVRGNFEGQFQSDSDFLGSTAR